jgi:hypothetical protein
MGGSILPVTILHGQLYFLFGKERDMDENPGWSDFGGGTDKGETFLQTAIREGGEEMTGFLGDVRKLLNKYGTFSVDYLTSGYPTYRCHLFPMEYDEHLALYYNNNQQFLQKRLDPKIIQNTKIFEKTQIKWFSWQDMATHRSQFRSFYKNVVDLLFDHREAIEQFIRSKLGRNQNRNQKQNQKQKQNQNQKQKRKSRNRQTKTRKTRKTRK